MIILFQSEAARIAVRFYIKTTAAFICFFRCPVCIAACICVMMIIWLCKLKYQRVFAEPDSVSHITSQSSLSQSSRLLLP